MVLTQKEREAIIRDSPSGKGEEWLEVHPLYEGSGGHKMRDAKAELLQKVGSERKGDEAHFLSEFLDLAKGSRALRNFMEVCNHCGICLDKCNMWVSTGDVNNSPVGRAELVRRIYRKGTRAKPSDVDLEKIYSYYYQCTECRRCSIYCPFGIDQSEITRNVREVLTGMGRQPEYVVSTMAQVYRVGNNLGLNPKATGSAVDFVKETLAEECGREIPVPVDSPKAGVLLVPSSADLFVNLDTFKGYAKYLYATKRDYTLSTETLEAANFGLFASEKYMRAFGDRVVNQAVKRGVKLVAWGECGHGWRVANGYVRNELAKRGIALLHIHQMVEKSLSRGEIKVDRSKNDHLYNYHDPCNYARGGNLINEPREVLRAVVRQTVAAEHEKDETYCCGAGGGLLAEEKQWHEYRCWAGWPAVRDSWKTGADVLVSPCAIDKAQFPQVIDYHKVKMEMKGLMDLVGEAIEL
jgi:Fe-S oxidoreductase